MLSFTLLSQLSHPSHLSYLSHLSQPSHLSHRSHLSLLSHLFPRPLEPPLQPYHISPSLTPLTSLHSTSLLPRTCTCFVSLPALCRSGQGGGTMATCSMCVCLGCGYKPVGQLSSAVSQPVICGCISCFCHTIPTSFTFTFITPSVTPILSLTINTSFICVVLSFFASSLSFPFHSYPAPHPSLPSLNRQGNI